MIDFAKARINMLDCQVRPNDVTSHPVLEAFGTVPREEFVPASQKALAYIDEDLPIASDPDSRFLMDAMPMSKLIQLADVSEDCIVLDVGCGTGYSTAILSSLCDSVVAVECDETLAEQATNTLLALGYDNTVVVSGALQDGYAKEGPYDVIFVGGAVDAVPDSLKNQLKDGGRLVAVVGHGNTGTARLIVRNGDSFSERTSFNCSVKALPGFEKAEEFVF